MLKVTSTTSPPYSYFSSLIIAQMAKTLTGGDSVVTLWWQLSVWSHIVVIEFVDGLLYVWHTKSLAKRDWFTVGLMAIEHNRNINEYLVWHWDCSICIAASQSTAINQSYIDRIAIIQTLKQNLLYKYMYRFHPFTIDLNHTRLSAYCPIMSYFSFVIYKIGCDVTIKTVAMEFVTE